MGVSSASPALAFEGSRNATTSPLRLATSTVSSSRKSTPCGVIRQGDEYSATSVTITVGRSVAPVMSTSTIAMELWSRQARASRRLSGEKLTSSERPILRRA